MECAFRVQQEKVNTGVRLGQECRRLRTVARGARVQLKAEETLEGAPLVFGVFWEL
jgi:hypothetical protein